MGNSSIDDTRAKDSKSDWSKPMLQQLEMISTSGGMNMNVTEAAMPGVGEIS